MWAPRTTCCGGTSRAGSGAVRFVMGGGCGVGSADVRARLCLRGGCVGVVPGSSAQRPILRQHTNTIDGHTGIGGGPLPLWVEAAVRLFAEGPENGQGRKKKKSKKRRRQEEEEEGGAGADENEEAEEEERRYVHELRKVCVC